MVDFAPALKTSVDPNIDRRVAGGIVCLSAIICLLGWVNALYPRVREIELAIPSPLHERQTVIIAAVSDIHLGVVVGPSRFERIARMIEPLAPDAVLFVGDVLDDHLGLDVEVMRAALGRLEPPLGIWGVLGNHEYIAGPIDDSIEILNRSGIKLLRDGAAVLGGKLLLIGRDDRSKPFFVDGGRAALGDILSGVPEADRALPRILLDHQPSHLEEAENAGIALQLSGHTHNGQLWPFNWIVASLFENGNGYSKRGDTQYWVSVGAGTWGPPMRTNARPEILLLKLTLTPRASE